MKKFLYMALFLVGPMLFSHPHAYGADSKEAATNWTTEKKTVGEVTITATFRNPEDIWDPGYLIFYVQLDSDTKNLDDLDFDKDIVLRDDNEWTYLPQMIEKRLRPPQGGCIEVFEVQEEAGIYRAGRKKNRWSEWNGLQVVVNEDDVVSWIAGTLIKPRL